LKRALLANAWAHRTSFERSASRLRPHIVARAALQGRERLIRLDRSRARSVAMLFERSQARLDGQAKLLFTLGYHNVLARGFALVRSADGAMLRRVAEVRPGSALDIEFADGHVGAHADGSERKREPEAKAPLRRRDDKQGSLL
jgi:exodeoxyribonuclease VII large subunit